MNLPATYSELRSLYGPAVDYKLLSLLNARKIERDGDKYLLPRKPPKDEPLTDRFTVKGRCLHCGGNVYRARQKYCDRVCMAASMTKPLAKCQICATEVARAGRKFCSVECRHEGMVKHGRKRRSGRFSK